MKRKKILVTGGTGYIGSHTVVELIKENFDVTIVDNLVNSKREVLPEIRKIAGRRARFFEVDLLEKNKLRKIFRLGNYDAVIHFAGLKAVAESVEKPLKYYGNNIVGTINLIEVMQEFNVKKLIFSSSATVYGEREETSLIETMTTGAGITNPYGKTKYMIEEIIKDTAKADKEFSATILRYFNPIGAHKSGLIGENPNDKPNNLMPVIMKVADGSLPYLNVYGTDYGTRDGSCVRDFIHVVDLAKGHIAALNHLETGVKTYNLGTGNGTSVLELIAAFENISKEKLNVKYTGRRAGDLPEIVANAEKAKRELGWEAKLTIEDAIEDTLRYIKNRN